MDKIMLIDSSEKGAEFIVRCLTKNGFDVIHMDGSAGLSLQVKITAVDLIIIDATLKDESGYDVCRKVKQLDETQNALVLLMGESESNNSMMRALESGADDYVVKSFDETNIVSKARSLLRIKHLGDQLLKQYSELEEKNKILNQQLEMAKNVQRSLIRDYKLSVDAIRVVSRYMPALEIGGDFYDITVLDDETISIVMGDVSGHGISAALLTAMLNMMTKNHIAKYKNPAQFLYHMNNDFIDVFGGASDNQMYACVFYALIDPKRKRIQYSNAGQALPIFINHDAAIAYELEASGTPIGMMKDAVYEYKIAFFDDNDLLLFYTDGLSDNLYKERADEFFPKIEALLLEMRTDYELDAVLNSVTSVFYNSNVTENERLELDDVSMILCKM
ncbi:transcriptional regulator [Clostridia bacterium]|nr:transcriptional regulator [Clostridia bacterium]